MLPLWLVLSIKIAGTVTNVGGYVANIADVTGKVTNITDKVTNDADTTGRVTNVAGNVAQVD